MKIKQIVLTLLAIGLNCYLACADGLTNSSPASAGETRNGYAPTAIKGSAVFVQPSEFWNGTSKEGTNGWRVQLRVYNQTNFLPRAGVAYPFSTNLMLSVEWGSPLKNSGDGYFVTPNGRFAKFELRDDKGRIVPPNPRFTKNLLARWISETTGVGTGTIYEGDLPAWLSLEIASVVGDFPETISTNVYPRIPDSNEMAGKIWSITNRPPSCIYLSELAEIYPVPNEGDYTLTIQPVLYKQRIFNSEFLDRVDLPAVTTKVHLSPVFRKFGDYSMMRGTNGYWIFINPSEFWNGVWKEDANGWRTQLRIYPEINNRFQDGVAYPLSTNLILRVEWGSVVKNSWGSVEGPSGEKYFMTPNGKFAKFELLDAHGNVVPPNPNAGINWMKLIYESHRGLISDFNIHQKDRLVYQDNLPSWVALTNGALVGDFPKTISTNVYPRIESSTDYGTNYSDIRGEIGSNTNLPPYVIGFLKLDEIYSVTNEGDYMLTVQPVLYKKRMETNILDRVDLPSVTTKVHLVPNAK